jgi:hypothetical protein
MSMIVHRIKDLSNSHVTQLLKDGLKHIAEDHLLENYHPDNQQNSANLFYILEHKRFLIGNYYVLEDDNGQYVGSAGWSQFTDEISLALVRAYTIPRYRAHFLLGNHILPSILEETENYKKVWLTFNEYNKKIYDVISLMNRGKSIAWPKDYKKFSPIGTKTVNNTLQYVAEYQR